MKKNAKKFAYIKNLLYLCIEIKKQDGAATRNSGNETMTTNIQNTMKKVNENVIIATSREMNEAGLFSCTPDDRIVLWHYQMNIVWKKMQWAPMIELHTEPLTEDIVNERGEVIEGKSTHKIDEFYGAPTNEKTGFDMRNFLNKIGVSVEPIEC